MKRNHSSAHTYQTSKLYWNPASEKNSQLSFREESKISNHAGRKHFYRLYFEKKKQCEAQCDICAKCTIMEELVRTLFWQNLSESERVFVLVKHISCPQSRNHGTFADKVPWIWQKSAKKWSSRCQIDLKLAKTRSTWNLTSKSVFLQHLEMLFKVFTTVFCQKRWIHIIFADSRSVLAEIAEN